MRRREQLAGREVASIASAIQAEVPGIHPLEAWRLAHGWSRPQAVAGIAALYEDDGLATPGVNSSMLCRWEHGDAHPGLEYGQTLCRLYRARLDQLGLAPAAAPIPPPRTSADVAGGWEPEGPFSPARLGEAVRHYAAGHREHPPEGLADEVRRYHTAVSSLLDHCRPGAVHSELCLLSALLGDLAHPRGDLARPAAGLAAEAGHLELLAWALWAHGTAAG